MLPKCRIAVAEAAKAAGRKQPTPAQFQAIEDEMSAQMRRLARDDPARWKTLTRDQQLREGATAAMADIKAAADRKLENAQRQIIKVAETEQRIQMLQANLKGTRTEALKRDFELTHQTGAGERKIAMGGLTDLIEAAGDKKGAGLGRRFLMRAFDAENPGMTRDVVKEIFKNADGHTGNDVATAAARAWLDTIEGLRTRFNAAGGDVGKLEYGYVPQPHDTSRIRKAGADAWVDKTMPLLDRSRYIADDGSRLNDADLRDALHAAYKTLATEGLNKSEPGAYKGTGARANRGSDGRQIHFTDGDAWAAYMKQFGKGSIYDAMMGHIGGMTRDIGLVERYGPNPNTNARLQMDLAIRADDKVGALSIDPQTYWDMVTGKTGAPANETLSNTFGMLRHLQTAAKLGGAIISSVTDAGTLVLTTGYNKLPYWRLVSDIGSQASKSTRDFMTAHGMIAESAASAMNKWSGDHLGSNWSGKLAQSTLKWSLLNAWTDGLRQGFTMSMNAGLARMAKMDWNALTEFDRSRLTRNGIGEDDWKVLNQVAPTNFKGRELLTPQSILASDINTARAADLQRVSDRIHEQTDELASRNAEEKKWISGRNDKFDAARDALNRNVKDLLARKLAGNEKATGPLLERMSLLDAQREQAKLQADIESHYNKLFTKADIDAFSNGVRQSATDLNSASKSAVTAAERSGRDFGIRKQRIEDQMREAQQHVAEGGDAETGLHKMAEKQAQLDHAKLQNDLEIALKATPDAERAAFRAAMDGVSDVKSSSNAGMSAAERIGRRYGEQKGSLERRMSEIQERIAKMDADAHGAANEAGKAAQAKADEMSAELKAFIDRSQERQAKREAVINRMHSEEAPRREAEATAIKQQIAAKVFGFIHDESEYAVLNPDMATRAVVTGGLQGGTLSGEVFRTIMQFKSFPIAMITRHWARMLEGDHEGSAGAPVVANRAAYSFALMATLTGLGAVAAQSKQVLQGKDPIDMTKPRFWLKALAQGGGFSIAGDMFLVDPASSSGDAVSNAAKTLTGPLVGSATELAFKVIGENIWQAEEGKTTHWEAELASWAKSQVPGSSLWWLKPFVEHGFTNAMNESLSPGYLSRMQQRAQKDFGQKFWWRPQDTLPSRAPDLAAAAP